MSRVLYVGLGTTGGWRHADRTLGAALVRAGVEVRGVWPAFTTIADALRRSRYHLATDLVEALAVRTAVQRNASSGTCWLVVSSSTAVLLLPRRWRRRTMLWTDTPVFACRPGRRNAVLRWRERSVMPDVRLVGLQPVRFLDAYLRAFPDLRSRVIPLPVPVARVAGEPPERADFGLLYAGSPHKKGLDIAVRAWAASRTAATLKVTGIAPEDARAFLADRGVELIPNVELLGRVSATDHRELSRRAALYLSTSRREEYGNAQLEALMDGAPLVSGPCEGTAEPRTLALELAPELVADDPVAGVAACVRRALEMPPDRRRLYESRARDALARYSTRGFTESLERAVVPLLSRQPDPARPSAARGSRRQRSRRASRAAHDTTHSQPDHLVDSDPTSQSAAPRGHDGSVGRHPARPER